MKREIKFRGKRSDNGELVYGDFRPAENCIAVPCYIRHFGIGYDVYSVDPDTVGQYTGLKDKNGREIYEGDIISARGIILTVKYIEGVFFACNVDPNIDKYPLYILCEWENESGCEIIGNIHNNPELLKTK